MELFIDTAEIDEIKSLNITGLIDGVTTNPSLIAKSGRNIIETIEEICNEVSGPVSAEVTATDFETMIKEGRKLSAIAQNVAIKVPLTFDGLRACKTFSEEGIMVNVTLCFNSAQAIQDSFKNCKLKVLKKCGHYPFFESPKEFNTALNDFLDPHYDQ